MEEILGVKASVHAVRVDLRNLQLDAVISFTLEDYIIYHLKQVEAVVADFGELDIS